jgi:hypothetical protein
MEWIGWALAEGATMGAVKVFGHSAMGPFVSTIRDALLVTGLTGLLQALIAGIVIIAERQRKGGPAVFVSAGYLKRTVWFAFWAGVATVCAYYAFVNGARADVGANTFIVAVLPIFGTALVERIKGGRRWKAKQKFGFAIAVVAAVLVTCPALRPGNNPIWILISAGTAVGATGTRLVMGSIRKWERDQNLPILNSWVLQLWGGGIMAALCFLPVPFWVERVGGLLEIFSYGFLRTLCVVAVGNMMWWTFRLWAVPNTTPLAVKELVAGNMYLTSATLGSHFFAPYDLIPPLKLLGLFLFIPAFFCTQNNAWKYCVGLFKRIVLHHGKPALEQPVMSV